MFIRLKTRKSGKQYAYLVENVRLPGDRNNVRQKVLLYLGRVESSLSPADKYEMLQEVRRVADSMASVGDMALLRHIYKDFL